jgi:hypothetical protein
MGLLAEHRLELGSDERTFVICGEELEAEPFQGNTLVLVEEGTFADVGMMILTGDQFGPFEVTTRQHDGLPPEPGPEWEDVVELTVRTGGPLVVAEFVSHEPSMVLVDRPGEFRVRVSARGRAYDHVDEDGEPLPEDEVVEWYLVDAWPSPSAPAEVVRLTSDYAVDQLAGGPKPLMVPESEAGLAAATRIGRDIDRAPNARSLSGRTGTVRLKHTLAGTRRKLFQPFAYAINWSPWVTEGPSWSFMSGPGHEPYDLDEVRWAFAHKSEDQLSGCGAIRTQFTEVDPPSRAVRRWEWVAPRKPGDTMDLWLPVLAQDTYTMVTLTQDKDANGQPVTTVNLEHVGLPEEWIEDMTCWWQFQFAIADHAGFGTK